MSDNVNVWQPGRSSVFLQKYEYAGQPIIKEERQMRQGKSDGIIVPVKAGNAAGGKDAT